MRRPMSGFCRVRCVRDLIFVFQIPESNTVAETPCAEVNSGYMRSRDVIPVVDRKAQSSIRRERVLEVAEAIEGPYGTGQLIICFG